MNPDLVMRDLLRAEVRAGVAEIPADLAEIRQRIDRLVIQPH